MQKNTSNNKYLPADTYFFVNEDKDLIPIKILLPKCPDITTIDGYGLYPTEQKFQYQKYPHKLKKLEKDCGRNIDLIWQNLNKNQLNYKEEIQWIRKQWYHRLFGYWFFNNGKPTYIDGWHFYYLNYFNLDVGLPKYRDRDRRWILAQRFAYEDTMDFVNKDEEGNAITEQDGTYKMYDTKRKVCWGTTDLKGRRFGDTLKSLSIGLEEVSRTEVSEMGIQGELGKTGKKDFDMMVHAWRRQPFFFSPKFDNPSNPQEKISFFEPSIRGINANISNSDTGLESAITYASTSDRGFYDGRKLNFYLSDEDGKVKEEDVTRRWDVIRKCLSLGNVRVGFSIHPTTVGDFETGGGKKFRELCDNSNYYIRNKNGETISGLYNFYFRATDGMEGFIDEYGISEEDKAAEYLNNSLSELLRKNTEESLKAYRELKRLMPPDYASCWLSDVGDIGMPYEKIDARINTLMFDRLATRRVKLSRINDNPEGAVLMTDDPQGRFWVSYKLPAHMTNQRFYKQGSYFPKEPKFIASADTYRLDKPQGGKMSKGGGSVFWEWDSTIDPPNKSIDLWTSNIFVCDYLGRPGLEVYWEDMLMMCEYFGALMYPENNVSTVIDHFKRRGREGYLLYGWDATTNRLRNTAGFSSLGASKQEIFNQIIDYLQLHCHREKHINFLNECRQIKGLADMTNYDLFTARGGCLMGSKARYKDTNILPEEREGFDVNDLFKRKRVR